MSARVYWFVYWNLVFIAACWFTHETWPWGLIVIPFSIAYVALLREARRRGIR